LASPEFALEITRPILEETPFLRLEKQKEILPKPPPREIIYQEIDIDQPRHLV